MVHRKIGSTHLDAINAVEDWDKKWGFGNCDEVVFFTNWRNGGWKELDPIIIGEYDDSVVGYKEGKIHPWISMVYSMSHRRTS